jgi:hypothetical protein
MHRYTFGELLVETRLMFSYPLPAALFVCGVLYLLVGVYFIAA